MTAEQIRDSLLFVSGALDDKAGGPAAELTPLYDRRTIYGHVSRYKLDQYLQLFDFPSPNLSAEKRFTTTVPLQRLFLMNSDFMQIEAEELAKRVANEPNNRARIRKLYQLAFGREARESEIAVALDYLKSEPMMEYEEFKSRKSAASNTPESTTGIKPPSTTEPTPAAGMPPDPPAATDEPEAAEAGMMAGVPGFGQGPQAAGGPPEYTPTPLGRYAKVLLSSSEFMFIN
jgi:hypothetical protein